MDKEKIEGLIYELLEALGEDPDREGLRETPKRIGRMAEEVLSGYEKSPEVYLNRTFDQEMEGPVIEKGIPFYSLCEHHMLPFFGKVSIAYEPDGRVVGLSKLTRTVEVYAKRLQLQERMTSQIAQAIMDYLKPKACLVLVEAEHLCMSMRGVKKPGVKTKTLVCKGLYLEDFNKRQEILNLMED